MRIISWNVNGLRAIVKKDFFKSVQKLAPDILCLQETKAQCPEVDKALVPIDKKFSIFCNAAEKKGYSGTALLAHSQHQPLNVNPDMGIAEHDQEGRILCAEFENFQLLTVYVPNAGQGLSRLDYREQWDQHFLSYLKKLEKEKPLIVCGDLNVAHRPIDLKNDKSNYNKTAGYTQTEIDGMDRMLAAGFVDIYRQRHPEQIAYTYWSYRFNARARNTGWRIDYFLVSSALVDKVKKVDILPEYYGSDHCPIALDIEF